MEFSLSQAFMVPLMIDTNWPTLRIISYLSLVELVLRHMIWLSNSIEETIVSYAWLTQGFIYMGIDSSWLTFLLFHFVLSHLSGSLCFNFTHHLLCWVLGKLQVYRKYDFCSQWGKRGKKENSHFLSKHCIGISCMLFHLVLPTSLWIK